MVSGSFGLEVIVAAEFDAAQRAGVFWAYPEIRDMVPQRLLIRVQDGMPLIDKNILVSKVLSDHPQTISVFLKYEMLCVGCLVAPFHTIEDACLEHELDETTFRRDLTAAIAAGPGSG